MKSFWTEIPIILKDQNYILNDRQKALYMPNTKKKGDQKMEAKDPFLRFGNGIVAYRHLLRHLMLLFFLLSLLSTPVMFIYRNNDTLNMSQIS